MLVTAVTPLTETTTPQHGGWGHLTAPAEHHPDDASIRFRHPPLLTG
uniref:Uncharacterized protein n=1 Tax=Streptomyces kanamyceticus TaxID=1967 RepID=E9KTC4_STRKN|nr:hypothetical protein Tcs_SK_040 [Streptomyces kanamyceticus]